MSWFRYHLFKSIGVVCFSSMLLSGCSWVHTLEGADKVKVVTLTEVYLCHKLGSVNTTVLAKIGFIERDREAVIQDSIVLAKNEALRMAGNRIVAVEEPNQGNMRFDIYQCAEK